MASNVPERVQKLIATAGLMSRRHAEAMIAEGKVTVNGVVVALGAKALPSDKIVVAGTPLPSHRPELTYILLNKPINTVATAHDPQGRATVTSLIELPVRLYPVGRLDFNTTGTLLLTNDGALAHKLMHPKYQIRRVYEARLDAPLSREALAHLNSPAAQLEGSTAAQEVAWLGDTNYRVTLYAGLNHHVKRLFELVGRKVERLTRTEFAGLTHVNSVPSGKWRKLTPHEIKALRILVGERSEHV